MSLDLRFYISCSVFVVKFLSEFKSSRLSIAIYWPKLQIQADEFCPTKNPQNPQMRGTNVICFVSFIFLYFNCIKLSEKHDTEYIHNYTGWVQIKISMTMCYCVSILKMPFLYHHTLIPGIYVRSKHHPHTNADQLDEKRWHDAESRVSAQADRFCSTTLTCLQLLLSNESISFNSTWLVSPLFVSILFLF